jgi:hypothetical protein
MNYFPNLCLFHFIAVYSEDISSMPTSLAFTQAPSVKTVVETVVAGSNCHQDYVTDSIIKTNNVVNTIQESRTEIHYV